MSIEDEDDENRSAAPSGLHHHLPSGHHLHRLHPPSDLRSHLHCLYLPSDLLRHLHRLHLPTDLRRHNHHLHPPSDLLRHLHCLHPPLGLHLHQLWVTTDGPVFLRHHVTRTHLNTNQGQYVVRILTLLEVIKETPKIQEQMLQILLQQRGNIGPTISSIPEGFPLKTVSDVEIMEEELANPNFISELVCMLSKG